MKAKEYWKKIEETRCRICGKKEDTEHVLTECEGTRSKKSIEMILYEKGQGAGIMKEIESKRLKR